MKTNYCLTLESLAGVGQSGNIREGEREGQGILHLVGEGWNTPPWVADLRHLRVCLVVSLW